MDFQIPLHLILTHTDNDESSTSDNHPPVHDYQVQCVQCNEDQRNIVSEDLELYIVVSLAQTRPAWEQEMGNLFAENHLAPFIPLSQWVSVVRMVDI